MINKWLITDQSIIDIENFKHLIYESVSDTSEKNVAETAEIAEASASSVLILEKVKQKKKLLKVSHKKDESIDY